MSDDSLISVKILNREYKVKCPTEQHQELHEAAAYVDEQMQKLRQNTQISHTDQIAVVAALNICHDWLKLKKQKDQYIEVMNQRLQDLQQHIEKALGKTEETLV